MIPASLVLPCVVSALNPPASPVSAGHSRWVSALLKPSQGSKTYKFCCIWGEQGAGSEQSSQGSCAAPSPPLHSCLLAGVWKGWER